MITYETFTQSCLDLSILGMHEKPHKSILVPDHARVLAWLTDSPVYFCQLPGQEETVFAVDLNNLPEEQVLPVAEDIAGFIGLLVSCKDAALIAHAHQWSSFRFQKLVNAVCPGMKAQSVLRALENIYHPPVILEPHASITRLQKEFVSSEDRSWQVGFDCDFFRFKEKGGKEVAVNRSLSGEKGTWNVPSFYLCDEGIVVDTYLEVSAESLIDFHQNWSDRDEKILSLGDKLQRYLDDPLSASVTGILTVNDKPLRCKSSFSALWNPLDDNSAQVRRILKHYRLDMDKGYLFRRSCFLRKGKYPQIRTIQLILEAMPVLVPDDCFTVHKDGMRFRFIHPSTGLEHIFTAVSLTQEALNPNFLTNHPCFYSRLTYTLEPSISPENFRVVDRDAGDYWEDYQEDPAAVVYADRKPDPGRYALSSLHYEPKDKVHWQIIFRRKLHPDVQLKLLP
jgi:hypothetical protein